MAVNIGSILAAVKVAANTAITGELGKLAALDQEGFDFLTNTVAPALDIPPVVVMLLKTGEPQALAALQPIEKSAIEFLQIRIDGML